MTNKGPLLILIGSLFFSFSGTLQALAPEGASPFTITESRMLFGALGLFAWCLISKKLPDNLRTLHWRFIFLTAVSLLAFQLFFFSSIVHIGVAVGTVIAIGSTPIWSAIIDKIAFKRSPPKIWYPATALAVIGILLLNWQALGTDTHFVYSLLPLLAGLAYAFEIIFSKKAMQDVSSEACMSFVMLTVALLNLPSLFFFSLNWITTPSGLGVALGLGIVTASLAFGFFFSGAKTTTAPVAATLGMAEPLGAAVWGVTLLGEPCGMQTLVGIALILISIGLLIKTNN